LLDVTPPQVKQLFEQFEEAVEMSPPGGNPLPKLDVADFGPGLDHVVDVQQNGKVIAIVHKNDAVRQYLVNLAFDPVDTYTYVFVHGGEEVSRFENLEVGTHEIPDSVVAQLLVQALGVRLDGLSVRMCTCYGNMLRPGDSHTAVAGLAGLLPKTSFEAYHGLVHVIGAPRGSPRVVLGKQLRWDPVTGPYQVGPPGPWENV
jgi:hypothetical protein